MPTPGQVPTRGRVPTPGAALARGQVAPPHRDQGHVRRIRRPACAPQAQAATPARERPQVPGIPPVRECPPGPERPLVRPRARLTTRGQRARLSRVSPTQGSPTRARRLTRDSLLPGLVHQAPTAPFPRAQARTDRARTELAPRAPARRRLPHSLPRRSRPAHTPPEHTRQALTRRDRRDPGLTPPDRLATGRPPPGRLATGLLAMGRAVTGRLKDRLATGRPPPGRAVTGRLLLDRPGLARRAAFRLARFRGPAGRRRTLRGVPAPDRPAIRGLRPSPSPGSGPGDRNRVTATRPGPGAAGTPGRECLAREAHGQGRDQRLTHGTPARRWSSSRRQPRSRGSPVRRGLAIRGRPRLPRPAGRRWPASWPRRFRLRPRSGSPGPR